MPEDLGQPLRYFVNGRNIGGCISRALHRFAPHADGGTVRQHDFQFFHVP
ncbi:MAG: hypothetical protein R3C10_12635 [Pirellulales bacterium]